jgi:lipoprotein NlpD
MGYMKNWRYGFILLIVFLCSCSRYSITDWTFNANKYTVKKGDTLYSIAHRHRQNYKVVAQLNHIRAPYNVRVGQVLFFKPQVVASKSTTHWWWPSLRSASKTWHKKHHDGTWLWPAHGRLMHTFNPHAAQKGIDIIGRRGDKIHASAAGVVAYSGSGLTGYDYLIIIKHEKQYLTAYGHNARNLVKEGQIVKAGEIIADMGLVERGSWGLHFEIRKAGNPVNPLDYLE